jgi:catechol 2,3-dioxygenase-like lactoylglutathione lyase family enzyme
MKRLHVHVAVPDLDQSIRFYSTLFGTAPTKRMPDYAKWMLDDPRVNFAISSRGRKPGIDHVGVQVDSRDELAELSQRLKAAGETTFDEEAVTCCYARGDKSWVSDPSGVRWETFYTFGDATAYGEDPGEKQASSGACVGAADAPALEPPIAAQSSCCGASAAKVNAQAGCG